MPKQYGLCQKCQEYFLETDQTYRLEDAKICGDVCKDAYVIQAKITFK